MNASRHIDRVVQVLRPEGCRQRVVRRVREFDGLINGIDDRQGEHGAERLALPKPRLGLDPLKDVRLQERGASFLQVTEEDFSAGLLGLFEHRDDAVCAAFRKERREDGVLRIPDGEGAGVSFHRGNEGL